MPRRCVTPRFRRTDVSGGYQRAVGRGSGPAGAAEISDGIVNLRRTGSAAKAAGLDDLLELVLHLYGERVLPFDIPAARLAGEWMDAARAAGRMPGFADIAVVA